MPQLKAGIFILTQNTVERKVYLKTCLYFLFRNFNKEHNYPIIILHEGDYDNFSQNEILKSIRENNRSSVSFKQIDKDDFTVPKHIDTKKLEEIISLQPVPYWRNLNYRLMCNFWMNHFMKYTEGFDYVMRLDDDSIIEEPLTQDLFRLMDQKKLVYMSNLVHIDCGICNYGMKDLFEKMLPTYKEALNNGMFVASTLKPGTEHYEKLKKICSIVDDKECNIAEFNTPMPLMYYNNFFVTDTKFWKQNLVKDVIQKVNEHGGIFYYRYGDAPLQTIIATLFAPSQTTRVVFKYSKRLQRESFIDSLKNIHSYMPKSYDHSTCISNK